MYMYYTPMAYQCVSVHVHLSDSVKWHHLAVCGELYLFVQPVICSELEDMKEASKMTTLPFPPPTSSSALNTLVLDSGHHTFTLTPPTSHITTLTQHTSPQGEDVLENVSVTDTSTSAGSHERVNGFGKK